MGPLAMLAMQKAGDTVSSATNTGLGLIVGGINDRRQIKQQGKLQEMQIKGMKEMADYNYGKQLQMWQDTGYEAQKAQMKAAGLNPGLMYGMSGGGGQTVGTGSGGGPTGGTAPVGGGEAMGMIGMGLQMELLRAQKDVMESQAQKNRADAALTAGAQTGNVKEDTENKILQGVILQYTGKEAKDTYERITSPNRSIQAKTYEDELGARQGVAGTIYEMWLEGKLYDKADAELKQIILQNAKSEEERKKLEAEIKILGENLNGVKLDNAMKEARKEFLALLPDYPL